VDVAVRAGVGMRDVLRAVEAVAAATTALLAELPDRRVPPSSEPPLRRLASTD